MSQFRFLSISMVLVLVSGCVVEQPRERVVVQPTPERVVVAPAPLEPEVVVVRTAPPVDVVEEVPAPRPGFVWARGYWRWNGARHEWVRGRWEPERVGYHYVQPHWDRAGGEEWHFTAGFWARGSPADRGVRRSCGASPRRRIIGPMYPVIDWSRRLVLLVAAFALLGGSAQAEQVAAAYRATWAGLPAGDIRLSLDLSGGDYRNEIEIVSTGLPRLLTKFRALAVDGGRIAVDGTVTPSVYDARYDLRKRRDSRVNLNYVAHDGAVIAERGTADTSGKPPLAESFRRDALDPLVALTVVRHELAAHRGARRQFIVPIFDGARRFDVVANVVDPDTKDHLIRLRLALRPIAGFKGESSEDGDPDSAPRPVDAAFSDDAALLLVSLRVSVAYLPLEIRLVRRCDSFEACTTAAQ